MVDYGRLSSNLQMIIAAMRIATMTIHVTFVLEVASADVVLEEWTIDNHWRITVDERMVRDELLWRRERGMSIAYTTTEWETSKEKEWGEEEGGMEWRWDHLNRRLLQSLIFHLSNNIYHKGTHFIVSFWISIHELLVRREIGIEPERRSNFDEETPVSSEKPFWNIIDTSVLFLKTDVGKGVGNVSFVFPGYLIDGFLNNKSWWVVYRMGGWYL